MNDYLMLYEYIYHYYHDLYLNRK